MPLTEWDSSGLASLRRQLDRLFESFLRRESEGKPSERRQPLTFPPRAVARLAAIVAQASDAIIAERLDGTVTDWNAAAERMYGYTAEEMVGRSLTILVPEDRKPEVRQVFERIQRGEALVGYETIHERKDGTRLEVSLTFSPLRAAKGEVVGASTIARDITRRRQAERELQEWTDRLEERIAERSAVAERRGRDLRELATQVTNAEERARKRIAQEIHDDLQQILVATKMRLPAEEETATGEDLRRISDLLDEALERSRSLIREMSPPYLHDGPLADAFEWLACHMREDHSLHVDVACEGDFEDLDETVETVVFEVVRELLFNVVKHAKTDQATVVVARSAGELRVRVEDHGLGFDPRAVKERSGFGLLSVRERVNAYGGKIEIDSAPGNGARITITLPFGREESRSENDEEIRAS